MGTFCLEQAHAKSALQLRLGELVSVYSEKAYRRSGGKYFEAVGNVVIISGKDTLYGEKASVDTTTGKISVEGSVRYIGQNITIYGAKLEYDMNTSQLEMFSSRMITPDFSIVASYILRKSTSEYYAKEAEFTTCRDCAESWLLTGKEVYLEIGKYLQVYHALTKVKGVDVLYLPYIAIPVKNKRESGILFPRISTRNNEGFYYEQPLYWAIDDSRDMTITPTFLSERGYGTDLEYRQMFSDQTWLEISNKALIDAIYFPGENNTSRSGEKFFRQFMELETHTQWSNDFLSHFRFVGSKDNEFQRDFQIYTDDYIRQNDIGVDFFTEKRWELFQIGLDANYKNNLIVPEAVGFDENYVQTLPRIYFSTRPISLWEWDKDYLYKMYVGLEGDYTVFKQNRYLEIDNIRNARRTDISTYLTLELFNWNALNLKTHYQVDYQGYNFLTEDYSNFYKQSGVMSTELSFTVDRIFGLAYREEYTDDEIAPEGRKRINKTDTKQSSQNVLGSNVIGSLPKFDSNLSQEKIVVSNNSYRHSQEFKLIHHQLVNSYENGNPVFEQQIKSEDGWFDYRDAIKADIIDLQANIARQDLPLKNTLELKWNNILIKKSPKVFNYREDNKYLRDNFQYSRLGFFNISQGFLLEDADEDFSDKLTRLLIEGHYSANSWSFNFKDYYFHQDGNFILAMDGQKRFEAISLLAQYNYNSFPDSTLRTMRTGVQWRPMDILGMSFLKEFDLDADEDISSIYQLDFMPNNNCWIINFSYQESFIQQRFAMNFVFNFGNDEFANYRNNFFNFSRLGQ